MADRTLANDIRRLVDEEVPHAPWLEDRIIAAVLRDAAGRSTSRLERPGPRFVVAVVAAAIIAVLAVTVLLGTRLAEHPTSTPASKHSPSRDAAVLRYRALIDRDMEAMYSVDNNGRCITRQQCIADAMKMRAAAESLLSDIESMPPPSSVASAAANLKTATKQYIEQLDAAIAAMQAPNSDYVAYSSPSMSNLDLAVATVDCWPVVPVVRGDLVEGYGCTAEPTNSYGH